MKPALVPTNKIGSWLFTAWLLLILAGCSNVRLVADYDEQAVQDLSETSTLVFTFYDRLLEDKSAIGKIPYAPYAEAWGEVETRLRVRQLREQSRSTNGESVTIITTTLDMWIKYRDAHRLQDDYPAAKMNIDRDHMARNLGAAMNAEIAKDLTGKARAPLAKK
jgi:hypothetical protein